MADPTAYTPAYSFTGFQTSAPDEPLPANHVDTELASIAAKILELVNAVKNVRRSDGALKNSIVTLDSLSSAVLTAVSDWVPRGAWVTARAYAVKDFVSEAGEYYVCATAHTSGTFATDLAASKWMRLGALSSAASVAVTPAGAIAATTVQDALEELDAEKQPLDATLTAFAAITVAANKLVYATGADAFATTDFTAVARTLVACTTAAAMLTALGALPLAGGTMTGALALSGAPTLDTHATPKSYVDALATIPTGFLGWWPTPTPPTGWLARDGSLVSRETYAALFAVLVTAPGFSQQTFTVTIATPGVVTKAAHGFTGGERLRLSTTGALPTGLNATDDSFVIYVDADTFRLATTEANYAAGTAITTSGSQSGTHSYLRSLYGLGDGSTTFKLPDDRDLYTRGAPASGRAVGVYQRDAIRNITGTMAVDGVLSGMTGAFGGTAASEGDGGFTGAGIGPNVIDFNASLVVPTAAENRPVTRTYLPIIKT